MALEALLLSSDPCARQTISSTLDNLSVNLQTFASTEEAVSILSLSKFDALLVDCDDIPDAAQALQELRRSRANRGCLAFALVSGKTTVATAFAMGAHFVLDKPLSADRLMRSVRAAQGLILHERRGQRRNLRGAAGAIIVDTSTELPVSITNISEGGISIECSRQLDEGGAARLKVLLPGAKRPLDLKGEVIWTTIEGRAGIRFQVLPLETKHELAAWIENHALPEGAVFIDATAAGAP